MLRAIRACAVDNDLVIDFGVKGGELNSTTRAPQRVYYSKISPTPGQIADEISNLCEETKGSELSPLNGTWKLLFSKAADATFSHPKW